MLRVNCSGSPQDASAAANKFSLQSGPDGNCQRAKDYILNMSPRPSNYHLNSAAYLRRILPDQSSICWESEKASCYNFISAVPSSKSSADLMKEISTLEVEIMHLERHLLSLYRTAFEQHLPAIIEDHATHLQHKTGSPAKSAPDKLCHKIGPNVRKGGLGNNDLFSPPCVLTDFDDQLHAVTLKSSSRKEKKNADQVHRSLAEHLGTSRFDIASGSPDKLSEDIVRCIAAIYCKLASPSATTTGFSVSSSSSLSSSSTFSPRNLSDSWSPTFPEDAGGNPQFQGLKEDNRPYASAVEVLNISLDDDSFNYAAKMLQSFRSLVKSLEKVDPRKMKREEKLAFWINIHNALMMHAHLAYGTHNHVRSTSILKAAYNVGGECINAYVIQDAILGIRSHYSAPWLQTLLTPGKKFKTGNSKHIYAIEYPEPLVHFALCSGAHSDPAVRVYMAANIFRDLRQAKEDFIRGTIQIHKGAKIYLPKILCYYSKDMSLTVPGLLEVLNGCLTDDQQKAVSGCMKGRPEKYIYWVPQSSTFRYVIHREVAREVISI